MKLLEAKPGEQGFFVAELRARVAAGARVVRFEMCFSLLICTIRRQSAPFITESWQARYLRGAAYSLASLLFGPWGIPWGLIWTPWTFWVNLSGGVDVTEETLAWLDQREVLPPQPVTQQSDDRHNPP